MTPTVSRRLAARIERHENAAAKAVRKQERKPMEPKITEGRASYGFYRTETADRWQISMRLDQYGNVTSATLIVDAKCRGEISQVRIKTGEFVYLLERANGHFTDGRSSKYKSHGSALSALRRRAAELTESEA